MTTCAVAGCGRPKRKRGWCGMHYQRWAKHGDPETKLTMFGVATAERFWAKVERRADDECWPWTASTFHFGYGKFWLDGKNRIASRVAWQLVHGELPTGAVVRHTCDNPPCCNPAHLTTGTQLDNVADRSERDRSARGESIHRARLTADAVRQVRAMHSEGSGYRTIAEIFRVNWATVRDVVKGRTWTHVAPEPGDPRVEVVAPEATPE